jgi:DNA-binding MarR family transcriptional regulator
MIVYLQQLNNNCNKKKIMENKQHVQVPTMNLVEEGLTYSDPFIYACIKKHMNGHTKQAWPSNSTLTKISGMSNRTVTESIKRLEAAGYFSIKREFGKPNVYTFNDYKKFEIFSYDFLDRDDLTPKEKSYLIVTQPKMFKSETEGVITMSSDKLARSLSLDSKTLRKYEKGLVEKGLLDLVPYQTDNATGMPVYARHYDFEQWSNIIALKFIEQDERLDDHEHQLKRLEDEIAFLKQELQKQQVREQSENTNPIVL